MTRFVTIAGPDSGEFSGKPVMLTSDVGAWVAEGTPPLNTKQLGALCRSLAWNTGHDPEEVVQLGKATRAAFLLAQPAAVPASPSHIPNGPASSRPTKAGRTAGIPKGNAKTVSQARKAARKQLKLIRRHLLARGTDRDEVKIMLSGDADQELVSLWISGLAPADSPAVTLDAAEATIMLDAQPELRALWLAQSARPEPEPATGPLGMDDERYQLHTQAKQLAQTRCDANPRLDAAETYALAAIELEDRKTPGVI
jgi:hypothetical protein